MLVATLCWPFQLEHLRELDLFLNLPKYTIIYKVWVTSVYPNRYLTALTVASPTPLGNERYASTSNQTASSTAFTKPSIVIPTEFGKVMDRKDPLTKLLNSLERAVETKDVVWALKICTNMKKRNLQPTLSFYRLLLQILVEQRLDRVAEAMFDDAISLGLKPNREMWNYLLQVCIFLVYACFR